MKFNTAYGSRKRVFTELDPVSMTKQSFRDECNINNIMAKYQKTGVIEHVNRFSGDYTDFLPPESYHEAMNRVIAADDMFMSLPSSIRSRFANDPAQFLAFANDPANDSELMNLGILPRPPIDSEAFVSPSDGGSE